MNSLDFTSFSLPINIAVFGAAAIVVWIAGTRIAHYADAIAQKTGIGQAVVGLLLLGGITSLPEAAVTVTASLAGNAALAVNNLLGGVAMQVAILAVADAAIGRDALTSRIPNPKVLLLGSLNVVLLTLVVAAVVVGEVAVFGIGLWSWGILAFYLISIWMISKSRAEDAWSAADRIRRAGSDHAGGSADEKSLRKVVVLTVVAGTAILIAGFLLSKTGEAIAEQTGLGQNFAGAVLVAISTSLPEVSTVIAAVRLRRYVLAVSDIFGTNLFDVALIFLIDAVYRGGPVLDDVSAFSAFGALLGIVVTTLFMVGLIERRDRTVLRMGADSLAILVVYLGGLVMLYALR